eukprot:TRINITY_DN251_c1_g1_i1.p1 TRINITY_DN251_c1_g1~~TRINITY_DN251_c1_g1_i1.p1  ORF type:complete len:510 (-),score=131.49 TRINITY_DN251_c1_g1_i1:132-1661(-)
MSYATELLDGFELLYKRTDGVIKVSGEMASFFSRLGELQEEYQKLLAKHSKSFTKKLLQNPYVDGSLKDAWTTVITQIDALAAYHSNFAAQLEKDFNVVMEKYFKDKDNTRKRLTAEGQRLTKDWKTQQEVLIKAKQNYHKLAKEAEGAHAAHRKAQSDPKSKPEKIAELDKKARGATDKSTIADQEYNETLKATNTKQHEFYTNEMPTLLIEFQRFEEERINFIKETVINFSLRLRELPPVVQAAADQINESATKIDHERDITQFCAENKTGVTVPRDIDYDPYIWQDSTLMPHPQSYPSSSSASSTTTSIPTVASSPSTMKIGTYKPPATTSPAPKTWGLTASDQSLPQELKRSKLESQLTEIKGAIRTEVQARNGVEKLVQFYAKDPVAAKKAEAELVEADKKVRSLKESKKLILSQIAENGGNAVDSEDESSQPTPAANTTEAYGEAKPIKVRGLYDYQATCDTELSFAEGDILIVTEQDESGWWFAELNGNSGFVPQNYVTTDL